jgi:dehydrogenase/reductase SDR family protein 7B
MAAPGARAQRQGDALRFADQVVWITGASSGIGAAAARAFAAEGAQVVLSSRRETELEAVRQTCARPERHLVLPLDLATPDTFAAATARVLAHFGRVDVLVNNGGVSQRALAVDADPGVERALMEVDYFGPINLTRAVLPSMRARRAGRIVVVSSVMGYVGVPGRSSYAAAKHALHGYFDTLRAELWGDGVGVTLVCPGYVLTQVSANAVGPRGERHGRTDDTHVRGISPEQCAAVLLRAVARGRDEVSVGGMEVAGIWLKRLFPWLAARVVRRLPFPPRG